MKLPNPFPSPLLAIAEELEYLLAVVIISVVAGLISALKAYKTPVARNLVG